MPKAIIDELSSLPISRQRRYQLRKHRDRKCIRCGQPAVNEGYFCETHRRVHNVFTRELQRRRLDFKHRDYDSESYGFSFSHGRLFFDVANTYLEAARSDSSSTKTSGHLRVALVIGFTAVDAYLKTVADQLEMPSNQKKAPIDKRIEYLFRKFSTEPLDQTSRSWNEFKRALKLRDELRRPRTPSYIDVTVTERALGSIWSLLNTLNNDIYGSRWA
ncbi:MAG TPA: hypothetical protein VJR02_04350 [Pyrinomonadaceae bacterium]|nr:hypothetical protein [Pyrinomonadaceae bacterium]